MIEKLHTTYMKRWQALSSFQQQHPIDAWIQPISDEFQGEYPADYAQRLNWLCGFTGSAGVGIFPCERVAPALFVDGRYTVQAKQEVPADMQICLSSKEPLTGWLGKQTSLKRVGFDSWLHTMRAVEHWQTQLPEVEFVACNNMVDAVWHDRPDMPTAAVELHDIKYAGKTAADKIADCHAWLKQVSADALFVAAPDAVMWLLNIRGGDIPYNPLALSYALVKQSGQLQLFLTSRELTEELQAHLAALHVEVCDITDLFLGAMNPFEGLASCAMDNAYAPYALQHMAEQANCTLQPQADPTIKAKAIKNTAELEAMRDAHRRDGLAICKFLHWFYQQEAVDELQAIHVLEGFRKEDPTYRQPSFPTIAGAGSNGAIVHYRASEASNRALTQGELLLVDSGGQYAGGTTDITRTMVLGAASAEQKDRYTRVLKGHIALSMAQFPEGTNGGQLDPLARQYLWQAGFDYAHGTGHGVGAYLCVHEGPQSISSRPNAVALEAGMVLSNEPGYYLEGAYGIRIENLIEIQQIDGGATRRGSKPLTLAPYDKRLIDTSMLQPNEMAWLNAYHQTVYQTMERLGASETLRKWLEKETAPII